MTSLFLGAVEFESFELPDQVSFGGAQHLRVHTLIGGRRVIDVLGRDDLALSWSGILSGPQAADRARLLNRMRVDGAPQTVSWNAFCYATIITRLTLNYCSAWWIPYEIVCVVQADLAQELAQDTVLSGAAAVVSDLSAAAGWLGGSTGEAVTLAAELVSGGTGSPGQALALLSAAKAATITESDAAEGELDSADLQQVASAAGAIATIASGSGYLNRALANLPFLGF